MKQILIAGASSGIGAALYEGYSQREGYRVWGTSRHPAGSPLLTLDITCSDSLNGFSHELGDLVDHIDTVIVCSGLLHQSGQRPEKALREVDLTHLMNSFATNAAGHLLLYRHLEPFLKRSSHPVCVSLSARVGSIGDNRQGGWYAYRMSKAALNMGVKTLSIEWQRKMPGATILAVHPGTTDTGLSRPFTPKLPKHHQLQTPAEAAEKIALIADSASPSISGHFIDYAGNPVPW
ncbi:MAG: SDR family NAD(P)-dependent oxidoreductase [Pseudomonadota bacterium]